MPTASCFHSPFELVIELEYITGKPGFIFYNVMLDLLKKKKKVPTNAHVKCMDLVTQSLRWEKINAVKLV